MIDPDLAEDLEIACLDEMRGDSYGPGLARRLERAVMTVLRSRGISARVEAVSNRQGTKVAIGFLKPGARVEKIVLTLR
ncbi:MAG: hypothetical protein EP330_27165 [Deltaproteobacteria bacterium]|nr:MAG: hypothetical protein EP330_27165 [Deltaproteobacteria bacterium]